MIPSLNMNHKECFLKVNENGANVQKILVRSSRVNLPLELRRFEQVLYSEYIDEPAIGTTLLDETIRLTKILPTGCENLDELLDGGLRTGELLEIYGPPASGKTQIALQATGNLVSLHDLNVYFIDTTSSFVTERLLQIIEEKTDDHSQQIKKDSLSRVTCARVFDVFQLLSELEKLKKRLFSEVDEFCLHLKLIIVDSLAAVITPILGDNMYHGHSLMSQVGLILKEIASDYGIAVMIINNAVSNFGESKFKPSLGKSWLHVPHNRLFVQQNYKDSRCERVVTITKHLRMPEGLSTCFYISSTGLCSAPNDTVADNRKCDDP